MRKSKLIRFSKIFIKVAACICIVFTISSIVLLSVSATRNAIFNAIIQWHENYTEIKFGESTASSNVYRPTYLPEGFSENSTKEFGKTIMITYSNAAEENIVFNQWAYDTGTTLVDNENTNYSEIEISGNKAYLFKAKTSEDSNILLWQSKGTVFELISRVNSDELIRIGKSIKNNF